MRISSITKNAGKACNNRLYRHIRTFEKIIKNYFVICHKKLIQKAGAETELVYMKASKELLQKRLYKRNQVLNANSPFVITDEILEHHYHAFQEPWGEGEKVILQKEDIRYE